MKGHHYAVCFFTPILVVEITACLWHSLLSVWKMFKNESVTLCIEFVLLLIFISHFPCYLLSFELYQRDFLQPSYLEYFYVIILRGVSLRNWKNEYVLQRLFRLSSIDNIRTVLVKLDTCAQRHSKPGEQWSWTHVDGSWTHEPSVDWRIPYHWTSYQARNCDEALYFGNIYIF